MWISSLKIFKAKFMVHLVFQPTFRTLALAVPSGDSALPAPLWKFLVAGPRKDIGGTSCFFKLVIVSMTFKIKFKKRTFRLDFERQM